MRVGCCLGCLAHFIYHVIGMVFIFLAESLFLEEKRRLQQQALF